MKSLFSMFSLVLALVLSGHGSHDTLDLQEGKDYILLPRPVAVTDDSKIEVVEVFWYGCSHCFNLEPKIVEWKKDLAEDVNFIGMPAIWAEQMELHAKMFYANQAIDAEDKLHQTIFDEMNERQNRLLNEEAILKLVEKHDIDREKYRRAFNSFGVNSQVQQAKARMGAYGVRGTPELIVAGKYRITTKLAQNHDRLLQIASALIEKERKERAE